MKPTTDPIADMLNRIKNAYAVNKTTVTVTLSKTNLQILQLLKEHGYIENITQDEGKGISITLTYDKNGKPKIQSIKRISKPGKRIYRKYSELPSVLNDYGLAIISSSKGLMTNKVARTKKIGGEVICEIY